MRIKMNIGTQAYPSEIDPFLEAKISLWELQRNNFEFA